MNDPEAIAAAQSTYLPGSSAAIEFDGFGTALKPAFEPIVLARKPLSESTVAANVLRWRTGALNIDGCRIHTVGSEARAYTAKRTAPGATQNATGERHTDEIFEGLTRLTAAGRRTSSPTGRTKWWGCFRPQADSRGAQRSAAAKLARNYGISGELLEQSSKAAATPAQPPAFSTAPRHPKPIAPAASTRP
jgi:hypothetical protein